MKKISFIALLICLLALAPFSAVSAKSDTRFEVHLWEGPDFSGSQAVGQALFKVSKDGTSIEYKLIVANLDNITMAHIHLAPVGSNGGVVVWLFPEAPPPTLVEGTSNGVLYTGLITQSDLRGALAGKPLSALIDAMVAGNTYVNVHTTAFPGGEIRGQIK